MSEDFRTKLRAFEDRREREHNDPEPITLNFCRHCDEHTEPVNTREVLIKSHGEEATKALLIDQCLFDGVGELEGWAFMCSDCARPYGLEDHALLDFQQERIELAPLNRVIEVLRGAVKTGGEWLANKDAALCEIYERSLERHAGSLVVAIGEIAKEEIFSVDQKKIEKKARLRDLRRTVQIFEDSDARYEARGFGKPKEGTIGEIATREAKEELAEAEKQDA